MLADYIRDVANLKGTKIMCREGGCGACICTVKSVDPNTSSEIIKSVNSVIKNTSFLNVTCKIGEI